MCFSIFLVAADDETSALFHGIAAKLKDDIQLDHPETVKKYGKRLNDDDIRVQVVNEISRRLISVVQEDIPEIKDKIEWQVIVRENPAINAFYQPGGRLTVFTGLIDLMCWAELKGKLNNANDAMAAVIAHEISHGICRHGLEKLSWLPIQIPFLLFTPDYDLLYEMFDLIFRLPHSRLVETEADILGVELLARTGCFDPNEAPKMFLVLNQKGKFMEWKSTHPVGRTRAEELSHHLKKDLELYEANRRRFNKDGPLQSLIDDFKRRLENQKRSEEETPPK